MALQRVLLQACTRAVRTFIRRRDVNKQRENVVSYNPKRASLIAYLNTKLGEQDWSAVSDAATDLSILEILEARSMSATIKPKSLRSVTLGDSPVAIGKLPARADVPRGVRRG
jgi:hypothetical protein